MPWLGSPMNLQRLRRSPLISTDSNPMSAPKLTEPAVVPPRTTWRAALCETAIEVFSIMVGVNVTAPDKDAPPVQAQVTGVVGIAGAIRAIFTLQCSSASAVKIASQMLGISPDDPDGAKAACDAVGEVCNIVAGYFKARIGLGDACQLSVPTIIVGQDYHFHSPKAYERLEFSLLFEGETLGLALEIAQ
jgi:CheY-specific phosphatase CheX